VRVRGTLDLSAVQAAFDTLLRRHEALRTVFRESAGQPYSEILPFEPVPLRISPVIDDPVAIRAEVDAEVRQPFDLATGLLCRFLALRAGDDDHILVVTVDHIIADGWSLAILMDEFACAYAALAGGVAPILPELRLQYADYAAWQNAWLTGETLDGQLHFWRELLAGAPESVELPIDRPRPRLKSFRGAVERFTIEPELTAILARAARESGATMFMTLLAGYMALLARYSSQDDLVVGTPVANRSPREVEPIVGFFANSLVLRCKLAGNPDFRSIVRGIRELMLDVAPHQSVPFEKLVEELRPHRNLNRTPLFNITFEFQEKPPVAMDLPGLVWTPVLRETGTAKFDLSMAMEYDGNALRGRIEYDSDLFLPSTITRLIEHFRTLLRSAMEDPGRRLYELDLMPEAERRTLLAAWNDTATQYPGDQTIQDLFERQAVRTPDAPAVADEQETLTYAELDDRGNRIAARLQEMGVHHANFVALYMERSANLIAALLGTLKAGAAYVPLDPAFPPDRLAFMLRDSRAVALICEHASPEILPLSGSVPLLCLGSCGTALPSCNAGGSPPRSPHDFAYVIYTSGSTGAPKGVVVPHRAVVRLVCNTNYVDLGPGDVIAQSSNASFDAATFEIWGALLNGARSEIVSTDTVLAPARFHAQIVARSINTLWMTSGLFNQYCREIPHAFATVKHLLAGGDVLEPDSVDAVLAAAPPQRFLNCYGPTECTTFSTARLVENVDDRSIPIGRPIANTRLYILDRFWRPVPLGVPGELYIGGDGLAIGYLGRPGLTSAAFIPDPFSGTPGARLYRTGDMVRYLTDGAVEFLGRIDSQVKLRGFRIELGEIETALQSHPSVSQAVVVVHQDDSGDKRLVAYLVPEPGEQPAIRDLRAFLAGSLPPYMIPAVYVTVDGMPLNPNGKVDRKRLPEPAALRLAPDSTHASPRTPTEKLVAAIWSELLGIEDPGIHDNFFELGGHSLLATQMVSRLQQQFGWLAQVRTVFEHPTIAELSGAIVAVSADGPSAPLMPVSRDRDLPLSFAQQRLWFLEQLEELGGAYNLPMAWRIEGRLDVDALQAAIHRVVERHEVLRTVFRDRDGTPVQMVLPQAAVPVETVDRQGESPERQLLAIESCLAEESGRRFDLSKGPLLRLRLLRFGELDHALLMTLHHIITDGWSMSILMKELVQCYRALLEGSELNLVPLRVQYADFADWQRRFLADDYLDAQLAFWKEQLASAPRLLQLPIDRPRPAVQTFRGAEVRFTLDESLVSRLEKLSQRHGATLFMTAFCGFAVLLARYTGQADLLVGCPIANRNRREVEPLIGFFVNTLVLRADLRGEPSFAEALSRVREMALGAFAHQDLPFEKLVEELQPERAMDHSPLFQVMFALQNWPTADSDLPRATITPVRREVRTAKFDLSLFLQADGNDLAGQFEYNTDLFDRSTVERMVGHLRVLLEAVAEDSSRPVNRLPILSHVESSHLLVDWNSTESEYPRDLTVHDALRLQAARTPRRTALVFSGEKVTYLELDCKTNQLAHYLRAHGVRPGVLVGLNVERSLDLPIAIFAILKAGGAYVPLDPHAPAARTAHIIDDSGMSLVVTQSHVLPNLPPSMASYLCLDRDAAAIGAQPQDPPPGEGPGPDDLAYVIYTSGSTGRPKGVEITHASLQNYVTWANQYYFGGEDWGDFGLFTSVSFDFTVTPIMCTLTRGRRLLIYGPEEEIPDILAHTFRPGSGIDTVKLTPSHIAILEHLGLRNTGVKLAIVGGEALLPRHVRILRAVRPDMVIVNEYGPTEATVGCTAERLDDADLRVLIGRPISNIRNYVLDRHGNPVPVGVSGELYIGGAGLACGYRGRPDLSASRFVVREVRPGIPERLYATGDLARYHPDGRLELLGRADSQIKIRGYRVEMEEIESVLLDHPEVRSACVISRRRGDEDHELVAFVASPAGGAIEADLRSHLRLRLPEYMIPSAVAVLDCLPMAASGKVDRSQLAKLEIAGSSSRDYLAPRSPREVALARLWSEVLRRSRVGIRENFFDLGGHSMLAVQLMSRVQKEFGSKLPLALLFQNPTVEQMAIALGSTAHAPAWDVLVPFRSQGAAAPVALIPGAGGNVLYLGHLAHRLHADRPVYALQALGLDGVTAPLGTIEEIAAYHLTALRRAGVGALGALVGHSFGGRVAYEMALQLLRSGEYAPRVVVLDTVAPDPRYRPPSAGWDDSRWLVEIAAVVGRLFSLNRPLTADELAGLDPGVRFSLFRSRLEEAGFLPADSPIEQVKGLVNVFRASHAIHYAPVDGRKPRVALVRAAEGSSAMLRQSGLAQLEADPCLGWGRYADGPVELREVPGDHLSMFLEPNVIRLAVVLEGLLE
jgi:amino acid adenylation domain-containing protein